MNLKLITRLILFLALFACHKKPFPTTESPHCVLSGSWLKPNYESPLVLVAKEKLSLLNPHALESYAFAKTEFGPVDNFLFSICNQYKDRPDLIVDKFSSIRDMSQVVELPQSYEPQLPVWSQLTGQGYRDLYGMMVYLTKSKEGEKFRLLSECDYRFIFKEYLARSRRIATPQAIQEFQSERTHFIEGEASQRECTPTERSSINLFRGEGVLWPTSPESGAMRNGAAHLVAACGQEKKRIGDAKSCDLLKNKPFQARLNFAQEALFGFLNFSESALSAMENPNTPLIMTDDLDGDGAAELLTTTFPKKAGFSLYQSFQQFAVSREESSKDTARLRNEFSKAILTAYREKSGGLNVHLSEENRRFAGGALSAEEIETLSRIIDRHIHFDRLAYASLQFPFAALYQSPWISATAAFNQSHKFTFRGYARREMQTDHMGWLMVFRVPKEKIFSADSARAGAKPPFETEWLDESTFASLPLAKRELAVNKFAYAEPGELSNLLWLGDVKPPKLAGKP